MDLLKITREDNMAVWDEHFKTILLLLLETLGDKDVRIPTSLPASSLCVGVWVDVHHHQRSLVSPSDLVSHSTPSELWRCGC